MNSDDKGNGFAQEGKESMAADYGQRAATALDLLIPGPHRDKSVARKFGVSVRMAKYLRAGKHWTAERFTQASAVLGDAFDMALSSPSSTSQHYAEMKDIAERLARLEARLEGMDRKEIAGLAPDDSGGLDGPPGGFSRRCSRVPGEIEISRREGPEARAEGRALARPGGTLGR